jgi:hypothetical protein
MRRSHHIMLVGVSVFMGCFDGGRPPEDSAADAAPVEVPVDANLTFAESCDREFAAADLLYIEPALDGPALTIHLLHENDPIAPFTQHPLHASCIIVSPFIDGATLDAILDDAYWNATLGRMPGEGVWVLDQQAPSSGGDTPTLGFGVRNIPALSFPDGIELEFAFPVTPADANVTAFFNPQDELTEPDWITSSARPILTRHWAFDLINPSPVEPQPFSWMFTRTGHYFIQVSATVTPVAGPPLTATDYIHFVVVDESEPISHQRKGVGGAAP